jgi:hypothetical protein
MEDKSVVVVEKGKKNTKLIIILLGIIVVLGLVIYFMFSKDSSNGIIIRAKSNFKKAVDTEELRTSTFTYNGVARKCKEECKNDGTDERLYFVSYEGEVTAGLDFDKIDFNVDKKNKKMTIIMPEVKITNAQAFMEKQKYIFKNSKYDNVNEITEANRLCNEDIKKRASEDEQLLATAKDNAKIVLEQFFETWLNNYYDGYTLEIV